MVPLEHIEWQLLANWLRARQYKFSHIANEIGISGKIGMYVNQKKIKQGLNKGFPDYCIILKCGTLLFIELKRQRITKKNWQPGASPSEVKPEQIEWVDALNKLQNVSASICYGHKEAVELIQFLES